MLSRNELPRHKLQGFILHINILFIIYTATDGEYNSFELRCAMQSESVRLNDLKVSSTFKIMVSLI